MKESAQNAGDAVKDKMSSMKESVSDKAEGVKEGLQK